MNVCSIEIKEKVKLLLNFFSGKSFHVLSNRKVNDLQILVKMRRMSLFLSKYFFRFNFNFNVKSAVQIGESKGDDIKRINKNFFIF